MKGTIWQTKPAISEQGAVPMLLYAASRGQSAQKVHDIDRIVVIYRATEFELITNIPYTHGLKVITTHRKISIACISFIQIILSNIWPLTCVNLMIGV